MASADQEDRAVQLPLVLEPWPEGGFTVTSPLIPELITEGDTLEEALANVQDAWQAAVELYEDLGRPLPAELFVDSGSGGVTVYLPYPKLSVPV
ncbi:MAG: type II toxin-antitoxin system HicB family antitoxin [Chloroflexota bacterium]|nr:type II toxin-antitoxin system HicB family antitoxin [Chloroflexota bacterium]